MSEIESNQNPEIELLEPTAEEIVKAIKEIYGHIFEPDEILAIEEEFALETTQEQFDMVRGLIYAIAIQHGINEQEVDQALAEKNIYP